MFLLGCVALDCYLCCCRASGLYSASRPVLAHVTCLCVWLCSLVLATPKWIFVTLTGPDDETLCSEDHAASSSVGQLVSRLFHHTLGFLLPAAVLIICCCCVALRLHSSPAEPRRQRAFRLIWGSVAVFLVCWTPFNIALLVDSVRSRSGETGDDSLRRAVMVTSKLGYAHACLRPLVHLSLSRGFRTQALALLRCRPAGPTGPTGPSGSVASLWWLGVGEEPRTQRYHKDGEQEQMASGDHQMQATQC